MLELFMLPLKRVPHSSNYKHNVCIYQSGRLIMIRVHTMNDVGVCVCVCVCV
jgi:hypothetical protein